MPESRHAILIRTNPETLWAALVERPATERYWYGCHHRTDWKDGSDWQLVNKAGVVTNSGLVREFSPPTRLVLNWRNELRPDLREEGYGVVTLELQPKEGAVFLEFLPASPVESSRWLQTVTASNGWPAIVSSLKSLLETGDSLELTREWPT